jgi:hypothetical protein
MRVISSKDISRAEADNAGGMPVACKWRALSKLAVIDCGDR